MSSLVNKVLNFVGWETEDEEEFEEIEEQEEVKDEIERPQFMQSLNRKTQNKIVNIHSTSQFKVVVLQPEKFEDAKDVCDHLKNKKPIVVNLSSVQKELAQRIVDFLSGSVYGLDGNIQKVSNDIFIVAPHNVDIMNYVKEDITGKATFPWSK
ncbi:cell division protein SepF [Acetivibrio saccincola]|uniref:Cell division protein SepF n=1 Tax=Acetivibrio saccincola TaxID=1677857 RepID=A0A2K9EF62_9FIRM|nr:cell division protein SepF [Acetivibrio saccincola]AUG57855.1 Cell division protein SepF [Acetivibrio saccincola]NLW26790.1 cell division protein SepF [Acetivibrio saccincola]PQQ67736.1 cell division protein SepF [Acetivibrio saccincola]HOA97519.1 cell division protein SepF [Acetivibrio saccincola]